MDIGSKGLAEVNLVIPQSTSLAFTIVHKDDEGNVVDHSQSIAKMAIQSKDGAISVDLSNCCTCGNESIDVLIPPSYTSELPIGKLLWDMIVTMSNGEALRMAYGRVDILDTYAMDGS